MSRSAHPDRERKVFVVHGRNAAARAAMYAFLRSIGLTPIEWSHARALAGEANPYCTSIHRANVPSLSCSAGLKAKKSWLHIRRTSCNALILQK